jgi:hypothetical protein
MNEGNQEQNHTNKGPAGPPSRKDVFEFTEEAGYSTSV